MGGVMSKETEVNINDLKPGNIVEASANEMGSLKKVLSPEGPITITLEGGEKRRVFWARTGFDSMVFHHAYFKKKLKEMIDIGIVPISRIEKQKPIGNVDGKNSIFIISPSSIVDNTLKVFMGGTLINQNKYVYNFDLKVLSFYEPPFAELKVSYDYYEPEVYDEVYKNTTSCMMIYLSARDIEDHNKKVFKSPDDIGKMTQMDVYGILGEYVKNFVATEDELKNLLASPLSEANSDLLNGMASTPLEGESGEMLE